MPHLYCSVRARLRSLALRKASTIPLASAAAGAAGTGGATAAGSAMAGADGLQPFGPDVYDRQPKGRH